MSLKSGHRIVPLLGEEGKRIHEDFEGYRYGCFRLEPDHWFFTASFLLYCDKYHDFKFKPTDVLIMNYPKCGSTWVQEICWTLMNNPDLDNPKAKTSVFFRCPQIESDIYAKNTVKTISDPGYELYNMFVQKHPTKDPKDGIAVQLAELAEDPRVIKTQIPFQLLSPSLLDVCKVIYTARNAKDVLVSFYNHARLFKFHGFFNSLDSFIHHFMQGNLIPGPYWKHVRSAWERRHHPNMIFLYYEDLKDDPESEYRRIADFLNLNLTHEQIQKVVMYTSFEEMKSRDNVVEGGTSELVVNKSILENEGGFFKKGKVGTGKELLSKEQEAKIDSWIEQNLQNFETDFKYKQKSI